MWLKKYLVSVKLSVQQQRADTSQSLLSIDFFPGCFNLPGALQGLDRWPSAVDVGEESRRRDRSSVVWTEQTRGTRVGLKQGRGYHICHRHELAAGSL